MNKNYVVECEDIVLKSLDESDLEELRQWRNKENIRMWFFNSNIISSEDQKKWFNAYLYKTDDLMFIALIKENKRKFGAIGLYSIENKRAEIGRIIIGEDDLKGKGYGFKITKALCNFAFNNLELEEIYLEVIKDNIVAKNMYLKLGFKIDEEIIIEETVVLKMILKKII